MNTQQRPLYEQDEADDPGTGAGDIDDPAHDPVDDVGHGRPWVRAAADLAVAFAVGLGVRLWLVSSRVPSWWQDSDDYLEVSRHGFWSLDLWAGKRPPAVPLVLKLVNGEDTRFITAQVVLAAACWAALAVEVSRSLPRARATVRWGAAAAVIALSLSPSLTMWERSVLSESLATSSLALALAASLRLVRRPTWPGALMLTGAAGAYALTRDTHAAVVLLAVAGFVALWSIRHPWLPPRAVVAALAAVVVVAVGAMTSSHHGERSDFPTRNLYQARVLPYPDRVEWFADQGMPQADRFLGPDRLQPYVGEGEAPVTYVADDDPSFDLWSRWVAADGRATYLRWLATHPGVVLTEPREDPERTFNNAQGDRSFYAAVDQRVVPFLDEIFFPSRPLAIVVTIGAAAWAVVDPRRRSMLALVGIVCVLLALPHAALTWHADAMETARHMVAPVAQLHIGVLLLGLGVVAGPDRGDEPRPVRTGDVGTLTGDGSSSTGGTTDT